MAFIGIYFCMFVIAYLEAKVRWQRSTWDSLILAAVTATIAGIPLFIFYFG